MTWSPESVWDSPRPPAVEPCPRHVRVELAGHVLAECDRALRLLETSHPPTIYLPRDDVREGLLMRRIDAAWLDHERVRAQDGDFYGGWITAELRTVQRRAGHTTLVSQAGARLTMTPCSAAQCRPR